MIHLLLLCVLVEHNSKLKKPQNPITQLYLQITISKNLATVTWIQVIHTQVKVQAIIHHFWILTTMSNLTSPVIQILAERDTL